MPQFPSETSASGIWTVKKHKRAVQGVNWPPLVPPDPNFRHNALLIHADGANGSTNNTFLDSSTNNFSITRNGNVAQGSFGPHSPNWSNYFDGSGDYLTVASNTAFQFGTGDFTIESWVFAAGSGNVSGELGWFQISENAAGLSTSYANGIFLGFRSTGGIYFSVNGSVQVAGTAQVNTWMHVAITRQSGIVKGWINGTEVISYSNGSNLTASNVAIGGYYSTAYLLQGYVSNLRIVKGTALYTANFTPSTQPLTAVSGTSLLTCARGRFMDSSTNNFSVTAVGDVKAVVFSPFNPSVSYRSSVYGASAYFDASGDYLSTPKNSAFVPATGNFTIEAWVYPLVGPSGSSFVGGLVAGLVESGSSADWMFVIRTDRTVGLFVGATGFNPSSTQTVNLNAWNHVVICRSGSTLYIGCNGSLTSMTMTDSLSTSNTWPLSIGADQNGDEDPIHAFISDFRVVNGSALYANTSYTVPTAPLTPVTNTGILLNMANASLIDNSANYNLETVGTTQISTAQRKFGSASMSFDGSSSCISAKDSRNLILPGQFTVEFWAYPTNLTGTRMWVCKEYGLQIYTNNNVWAFALSSNNTSTYFWANSSAATAFSGTWQHVALVKSSSGYAFYVNGVSSTSTGTSSIPNLGTTHPLILGNWTDLSLAAIGYIDEFRLSNGLARYTSNFSVPDLPFADK